MRWLWWPPFPTFATDDLWLVPNVKLPWHINILSVSCTLKCLPSALSLLEPTWPLSPITVMVWWVKKWYGHHRTVQPSPVYCAQSLCRSSSALGNNHYYCWSDPGDVFCESGTLYYALLCGAYSYSARVYCRLIYSRCFPLCNRIPPAAVSERAQLKLFHSHTTQLGLLSRNSSALCFVPSADVFSACVQILHPAASGVGLFASKLQPLNTKLTCGTWISFLLYRRENRKT